MSKKFKKVLFLSALVTFSTGVTTANAAEQNFALTYSGNSGGSITGNITIEDSLLRNPNIFANRYYSSGSAFDGAFTALSLTVTGGVNGAFTLADFDPIAFDTAGGTLDLSQELVGQLVAGKTWGVDAGDFGLYSGPSSALFAPANYTLLGGGEFYTLTSFRPLELAEEVLLTLADVQNSLDSSNLSVQSINTNIGLLINGAHSRHMSRRVAAGEKTFWLAGDWGNDNHGSRSGETGLAEVGGGYNFGQAQLNVSIGKTWAHQDLINGGDVSSDGKYIMVTGIIPLSVNNVVYATLGGFRHWGDVGIDRG